MMNYLQKSPQEALYRAVKTNSPNRIQRALKAGARIEWCDDGGCTALDLACIYEHPASALTLLKAGALPDLNLDQQKPSPQQCQHEKDVNGRRSSAFERLYYNEAQSTEAVTHITKLLLEFGADVHAKDPDLGHTPLFHAVKHEHLPSMQLLLEAGADIDAVGNFWGSAINWASNQRAWLSVEYLLKCGANPLIKSPYYSKSAISQVCRKNKSNLLQMILERWNLSQNDLQDALRDALASGSLKCADLLMAKIKIIEARPKRMYETILHSAYDYKEQLIAPLVKLGADIDEINMNGDTLLSLASRRRNPQLVKKLIALGANVNHRNNQDISPLHKAARRNSPEIAQTLVNAGADIHAINLKGESPLDIACRYKRYAIIAYLQECLG